MDVPCISVLFILQKNLKHYFFYIFLMILVILSQLFLGKKNDAVVSLVLIKLQEQQLKKMETAKSIILC